MASLLLGKGAHVNAATKVNYTIKYTDRHLSDHHLLTRVKLHHSVVVPCVASVAVTLVYGVCVYSSAQVQKSNQA